MLSLLQYWMNESKYPHFRELIKFLITMRHNGVEEVTFRQLLDYLNGFVSIKPQTFAYHLEKLVETGILIKIKRDHYRISPVIIYHCTVFEWIDHATEISNILARSVLEHVSDQLIKALLSENVKIHREQALLFDHIRKKISKAQRELKVLSPSTYLVVHPQFKDVVAQLLQRGVDCSIILTRKPSDVEAKENKLLKQKGVRIFLRPYPHPDELSGKTQDENPKIPSMLFIVIDKTFALFSFLARNHEVPCDYVLETKSPTIIGILLNILQNVVFH